MGFKVSGELDDPRGPEYNFLPCLDLGEKEEKSDYCYKKCSGGWIHEEGDNKEFIRSGFNGIYLTSHMAVARVDPITS